MYWTSEEVEEGCKAFADVNPEGDTDLSRREVRAIMTRAVELVWARGGTMTAEDLADALEYLGRDAEHTIQHIRGHITTQGATVATLGSQLDALAQEKARWEAEMRDLQERRMATERERAALQARVDRDKAILDAAISTGDELKWSVAALRAEVEGLKGWREKCINDNNAWAARLSAAESRLAAIRDLVQRVLATGQYMSQTLAQLTHHPALKAGGHIEAHGQIVSDWADVVQALRGWLNQPGRAVEGAAPNSPGSSDGYGPAPQEASATLSDGLAAYDLAYEDWRSAQDGLPARSAPQEAKTCAWSGGECSNAAPAPCGFCDFHCGHARGICAGFGKRHPCSPTCTHDDAATPGHPERVVERSEAWTAMHPTGSCTCAGEGTCAWCDRMAKSSERAGYDEGLSKGWDDGAEAMRAACWEVVQDEKDEIGLTAYQMERLKKAVAGAAP